MKKEIQRRLIDLAVEINEVCKLLDKSYLSYHITKQIIRSSTSSALNYGEAQGAESKKDFIHKNSLVLKELKETKVSLILLEHAIPEDQKFNILHCQQECDELVAIFYSMLMTARSKI